MRDVKYIIVDGKAIVFCDALTHKDVARFTGRPVESAGFVRFGVEKDVWGGDAPVAHTYGRSESLDICSKEDDAGLITRQICSQY